MHSMEAMGVIVLGHRVVDSSETPASHLTVSTSSVLNSEFPWGQQFLDKACLNAKSEVSRVALEAV